MRWRGARRRQELVRFDFQNVFLHPRQLLSNETDEFTLLYSRVLEISEKELNRWHVVPFRRGRVCMCLLQTFLLSRTTDGKSAQSAVTRSRRESERCTAQNVLRGTKEERFLCPGCVGSASRAKSARSVNPFSRSRSALLLRCTSS
jgi:hypothetical protein